MTREQKLENLAILRRANLMGPITYDSLVANVGTIEEVRLKYNRKMVDGYEIISKKK